MEKEIIEPAMVTLSQPLPDQVGGRYITSIAENGQYLRVLIVFVQFKDDNWNTGWAEWPKNGAPSGWMGTNIIDQTVGQNSANNNLTHYYTVISMGRYKVIGDCYNVITKNTRDEYINMGYNRGYINKQLLQNLDGAVNYSLYDNWTKSSEFSNSWGPDGEVDMIWMVYRNIGEDRANPALTAYQLGFGQDNYNGTYSKWSGEASLGWGGILNVSGGKTIDLNGYGMVSGVTLMMGYNGFGYIKNTIIHEFGHHLIGGMEAHIQTGVWGMMAGYGSRSQMVNSYERHRLQWTTSQQYDYNPANPITLADYITTGQTLRIKVPGSSPARYYLLENHQRSSSFDNIDRTADGKGIYVLYQGGVNNNNISFYNAEGRADWSFDHYAIHPLVGVQVPVFRKSSQNPIGGSFDTQTITYFDPNASQYKLAPIEAYTINGADYFEPLFAGDGKDEMKPNYVEVFSPWSNPSLQNVSFQVISENSQLKIIQYVEAGTTLNVSPSKPQNFHRITSVDNHPTLQWDLNSEPDISSYKIYRSYDNSPFEIAGTVSYSTSTFVDVNVDYTKPIWDKPVKYYVAAVDNTNKYSVPSDQVETTGLMNPLPKINTDDLTNTKADDNFELLSNYPNPFNPSTKISYSLPEASFVTLKVYDVLGREIVTLVNEAKPSGKYEVEFRASKLTSGTYIYKLTAGNNISIKKMLLIK